MSSLISPLQNSLADEVLLRRAPAAVVLSLVRAGLLTLDDFWALPDPRRTDDFQTQGGTSTPRGLLWAWGDHDDLTWSKESSAKQNVPTSALWAAVAEEDPNAPSIILTARDRLLAWMFSDSRVWQIGELQRYSHLSYLSALDWALADGHTWAVDAAFRQAGRPDLTEAWWEQTFLRCVMHGQVDMLKTLLPHAPIGIDRPRVAIAGNLGMGAGSVQIVHGAAGYPLLHLAPSADMAELLS